MYSQRDLNPHTFRHQILSLACLPFHHRSMLWVEADLNHRHPDLQSGALPAELSTHLLSRMSKNFYCAPGGTRTLNQKEQVLNLPCLPISPPVHGGGGLYHHHLSLQFSPIFYFLEFSNISIDEPPYKSG